MVSLLLELDIHLPPDRTSLVVDHLNYDISSAPEKHDVLLLPRPSTLRSDVKNFFAGQGTIAFPRSVPQELGNASPHLAPILRAKSTAYSYNPKDEVETMEDSFTVGEQISLVSSMQARNSARFTVFGSIEALENKWFDAEVKSPEGNERKTVNREFAEQISAWTFLETGVLKVGRVEHHLSSISEKASGNDTISQLGNSNPKIYRIKNDVVSGLYCSSFYIWMYLVLQRHSISNSPNIRMIISSHWLYLPPMLSSSNLPCCPLSTASISSPPPVPQTAPSSAPHSNFLINMAFLPSASISSDLSRLT